MNTVKRTARYELLDVLRGVAILLVMVLHFTERGRVASESRIHDLLWPITSHGNLGVQLFFVISGYCITAALYATAAKPNAWRTFLVRRARRIYPPYWWSLVLVLGLGCVTCLVTRKPWGDVFPLTARDWLLNVALLQQPFQAPDANLVYWSLSIEVQFYAVMSLCLFRFRWTEPFLWAVSIVSAALLISPQGSIAGTVFAYWPQFACGIAAYYFITRENRFAVTPWLLTALTVATLVAQMLGPAASSHAVFTDLAVKLAVCLASLVLLVMLYPFDGRLTAWSGLRPLAWLGTLSYSLYLIHVPIGTRVFNLGERLTTLQGERWLAYAAAAFVASLVAGVVFHRLFEKPWMNASPAPPTLKPASFTPQVVAHTSA